MKKKILFLVLLSGLIVAVFLYWKPLLLSIAGVKKPEIETQATVIEYAEAYDNPQYIAVPGDKSSFNFLQDNFGVPGLIVFNIDHVPVVSSHGTNCPDLARQFLDKISDSAKLKADFTNISIEKIEDVLSKVKFIKGDSLLLRLSIEKNSYNYIVLYSWAKYMPQQSQKMFDAIIQQKQSKERMLFISLNLDYSNLWAKDSNLKW